ncbi:MAG: MerR family transcriptional regulator [Candidatus Acidiferrales bacterium]
MRGKLQPHELLRSGRLASLAGVSPDTLRFYEREGLLLAPQRSTGGYRLYSQDALHRVRLIRGALALGFRVSELAGILRARDSGAAPCHLVRSMAAEKLNELELRIASLLRLKKLLTVTLRHWDKLLQKSGRTKRAGLLEAFVAAHPEALDALSPELSQGLRKKLAKREKYK